MVMTFLDLGAHGRLGNQMWQIASTMGIANDNNTQAVFPRWKPSATLPQETRDRLDEYDWKQYEEPGAGYRKVILNNAYDWNLHGYFQSWKYFHRIEKTVRKHFDFCGGYPPLDYTSVHVRRGDYLDRDAHPVLGLDYYEMAFSIIPGPYLFFSDDIDWVMVNFDRSDADYCVEQDPIKAMGLMSRCRDNIIANSSFSWWAAYLNRNSNKQVVAPAYWVKGETTDDRLPPGWVKL